ncbi:hypothetical protein AVEN_112691-1, partial [Araneus ventricosus]
PIFALRANKTGSNALEAVALSLGDEIKLVCYGPKSHTTITASTKGARPAYVSGSFSSVNFAMLRSCD